MEENLEELQKDGILLGDLVNLLKDFNVILSSVRNCISRIAPDNDLVNVAFDKLSDSFNEKFIDFTVKMVKLEEV